MNDTSVEATAPSQPKASISLKVYRKATGEWEDGPDGHAVEVGLGNYLRVKLKVLSKLLSKFEKWLKKLEEMQ